MTTRWLLLRGSAGLDWKPLYVRKAQTMIRHFNFYRSIPRLFVVQRSTVLQPCSCELENLVWRKLFFGPNSPARSFLFHDDLHIRLNERLER